MKNKGVTILSIITNIILIAMLCSFIRINGSIIKEKQIIKEMSESTQVTDLNNQINALNTEHTEYMNYIQTCKAQLASAITDMGIETSENASIDTMISNIRSIFSSCDLENKTPVATSKSASVSAVVGKKYLIFVVGTRYPNDISLSMTGINILLKTNVVSTSSGAHGSGCMVVGIATNTTIKINCGDGYDQNELVASIVTQLD